MPAKRQLTMRQIWRLLRLQHEGAATREIGRVLGVARSTVQDALKRAEAAGVSWPLADDVTDEALISPTAIRLPPRKNWPSEPDVMPVPQVEAIGNR